MAIKPTVFAALSLNFILLLALTGNPTWTKSPLYTKHLSKIKNTKLGLYCLELDQMSPSSEKLIQIDETIVLLQQKKLTPPIPASHFKYHPKELDKNSQLFYSGNNTWDQSLRIGKDFLCESQIYNHIVGSHKFLMNLQDRETLAEYKRVDLTSKVVEIYDLSNVNQCEAFVETVSGYWYLKNHNNLKVFGEVTPKNVESFKETTKCPIYGKYAQKKFVTSEFVRKHYVVVFPDPFTIYLTEPAYEFEFSGESFNKEIIEQSFSEGTLQRMTLEVEIILWHFFKANMKKAINHPRTFEMFEVKLLFDHDFVPVLVDVVNFHGLANRSSLDKELQLGLIDLAFSVLLGNDESYLERNLFTRIF